MRGDWIRRRWARATVGLMVAAWMMAAGASAAWSADAAAVDPAAAAPAAPTAAAAVPADVPLCRVLDPDLQLGYQGGCESGLAQGQGTARGAQGAWYRGGFQAGMKSGQGAKVYPNGDAYVGGWRDDRREGQGRYEFGPTSPWRGDVYQGGWQADQRQGRGTYIFFPSGDRFVGQWDNGATATEGTTTVTRRKQAFEVLAPVIGQVGVRVCSVMTQGAGPDHVARGQVVDVLSDRLLVRIDSADVLARSPDPALNPRWEVLTEWLPCP